MLADPSVLMRREPHAQSSLGHVSAFTEPGGNEDEIELVKNVDSKKKELSHAIAYRPDIDGLRAVAIVPVVVYHAYPTLLPGGFIGVDIFFVISGYLISSILFKEHAKGKFTYADFYSRRIRRIFPALILVLAWTLAAACMYLWTKPLKAMAATLVAGGFFGANIQLMTAEEAYGDATLAANNPLLHLWSLGVEEQFYIFWPFFASLVVRLTPRAAILVQIAVIFASFFCNITLLGYQGDNKYAFYFPLSRFWQMAIGGLLAYNNLPNIPKANSIQPTSLLSVLASVTGITAINIGLLVLDDSMAIPGYWALLPTLGAAALVFAGPSTPFNKVILGSAPLVFIGKLSYAFYLWHWPLLVFAKVYYPNEALRPWSYQPSAMVLYSLALSLCTVYLVENNLRHSKSHHVVPMLSILMALVVVLAIAVFQTPAQFSYNALTAELKAVMHADINVTVTLNATVEVLNWSKPPRLANATVAKIKAATAEKYINVGFNFTGFTALTPEAPEHSLKVLNSNDSAPVVFAFGDSHMNMVAPRFARLFDLAQEKNASFPKVYFRGRNGSPPLSCMSVHATDVQFIREIKPKVVFYSADWVQWVRSEAPGPKSSSPRCCEASHACTWQNKEDALELVRQFQAELTSLVALGIKVFVATSNPNAIEYDGLWMLNGDQVGAVAPIKRSTFRKNSEFTISLIENATRAANATIVDYSDNQCYEDVCEVVSMREGEPVFVDFNHIRPYYARMYLSSVDQVIEAALN
ncbi:Aste57867_10008 [Aphanomyces stellatus]|uniref:Aste57867_10008 protein n=1 Tax=Aphanomyces stellatus TaxID=120398 RepID=A0A485KPX1_9STRA|nr:hypothetical protein As57867_009969 [Aphanomyces stellatus]VFT86886.1 Aste57867_10008 [Aphanomyces stellatus]